MNNALDTVGKVWVLIIGGLSVLGFVAVTAWQVRGVYERIEEAESDINYVDERHDRKLLNHEKEHHKEEGK